MRTQNERLHNFIAEQAAEWHVAHCGGDLSPEQAEAFMDWLRTSPLHVAEYLAISGIARGVTDAACASDTSIKELLEADADAETAVRFGGTQNTRFQVKRNYSGKRQHFSGRFARVAIACTLLSIVIFGALIFSMRIAYKTSTQHFATSHGEQRSVQLPDNTVVQLDSNSSVTVIFDTHERRVTLDYGRAYFQVAKDPERAFGVLVGNSLVRDVGTAFDIYREQSETTVTVARGRVQVWGVKAEPRGWFHWSRDYAVESGHAMADILAGQQAKISYSGQVRTQAAGDMEQVLAWTQGKIAFDNRAVAAVVAEFNRYNRQQIRIESESIGVLPITGTFDAHDVSAFVAFLRSMPGVRVNSQSGEIVVTAESTSRGR